MSATSYYTRWLATAWRASWNAADLVAGLLGLAAPLLIAFLPKQELILARLAWQLPLGVLVALFIIRLCGAPYWMYRDDGQRLAEATARLQALTSASPRIHFEQVWNTQLYQNGVPVYRVLQAWFTNSPLVRSEASIARQVSGVVEIESAGAAFHQFHGQWAQTTAPGHVGFTSTSPTTDIAPNEVPVKLNIALQYDAEQLAYGYAEENLHAHSDGRHPNFALPMGVHRIRVKLRGVGVSQDFRFTLTNYGPGLPLSLDPLGTSGSEELTAG